MEKPTSFKEGKKTVSGSHENPSKKCLIEKTKTSDFKVKLITIRYFEIVHNLAKFQP